MKTNASLPRGAVLSWSFVAVVTNPSRELRHELRMHRRRGRLQAALIVVAVLAVFGVVVVALGPMTWLIAGDATRRLQGKDQTDALTEVRNSVLAALGGTAALVGLGFTARTYYLSRRGQVTDRFSKAIGHLASDKLEERLGGIYALEHIMAESPRDHATILEVLCAFVRAHAPRSTSVPDPDNPTVPASSMDPSGRPIEPRADIDAVLTVLARRPRRPEPNRPDLRHTCLEGLILREFEFVARPRLSRVFLTGAVLRGADLRGLDLSRTTLNLADMRGADLRGADLTDAWLGADLREAHLGSAVLRGAGLIGTDLRQTRGLTAEQLSAALIDHTTLLPSELEDDPWIAARRVACQAWLDLPDKPLGLHGPPATATP